LRDCRGGDDPLGRDVPAAGDLPAPQTQQQLGTGASSALRSGLSFITPCCVPELATSDVTVVAAAAARYGVTVLPSG